MNDRWMVWSDYVVIVIRKWISRTPSQVIAGSVFSPLLGKHRPCYILDSGHLNTVYLFSFVEAVDASSFFFVAVVVVYYDVTAGLIGLF